MKILVVDDDSGIRELLKITLQAEGYDVLLAEDGERGLKIFEEEDIDLLILDLMLPQIDGWEVCKKVREVSNLPIIMLTARDDEVDTIMGLKLGADDYISKPFSPKELLARIEAVLRRAKGMNVNSHDLLKFPGLIIDKNSRIITINDEKVEISPTEFDLLYEMAKHPERVYEREVLLDRVWGYDYIGTPRTVDVHIKRLRSKLEKYQDKYSYIQTVWGVGYKFEVIQID